MPLDTQGCTFTFKKLTRVPLITKNKKKKKKASKQQTVLKGRRRTRGCFPRNRTGSERGRMEREQKHEIQYNIRSSFSNEPGELNAIGARSRGGAALKRGQRRTCVPTCVTTRRGWRLVAVCDGRVEPSSFPSIPDRDDDDGRCFDCWQSEWWWAEQPSRISTVCQGRQGWARSVPKGWKDFLKFLNSRKDL